MNITHLLAGPALSGSRLLVAALASPSSAAWRRRFAAAAAAVHHGLGPCPARAPHLAHRPSAACAALAGCAPCILLLGGLEGGRPASSWVVSAQVRGPAPSTQGAGQPSTLRLPSGWVHRRRPAGSQALLAWQAGCSWGQTARMHDELSAAVHYAWAPRWASATRPRAPHLVHTRAPPALPWVNIWEFKGGRPASSWVDVACVTGTCALDPGCRPAVHPPTPQESPGRTCAALHVARRGGGCAAPPARAPSLWTRCLHPGVGRVGRWPAS